MVRTTEEKLFGSKDIYRIIVDSAEEGIWIADKDSVITYVNKKVIDLLGYDKDQIIGKKMYDFTDDENRAIMIKSLEESLKGKRDNYSYSIRNKRGEFIPMMVATTPMQDEKSQYIGTVELMSDISYQKKIEVELREREEHLKLAQETAHIGSWVWDIGNNKQVWSDERYKIFGLSPKEIEPTLKLYLNFVHPEDRPSVENALFAAIREKKPFIAEYRIVRRDGAIRYMHSEGHVTYDDKGEPLKLFAIGQDITERRHVEDALRESEERFRALADNIPNLAWMANADGWIFWYNKQWYDYTGTTLEEMQGWGWQNVHHPDYVKAVMEDWSSHINAGQPYEAVFPLRGKDGNYRWFLTRVTPIRDAQGNIQRWFGTNTDITVRKHAEEALKESKAKAELYVDLMGHDINNLNQSAMGFLELALEMMETDKKLGLESKPLIERPLKALDNSSKLIDNVRKLQRLMTEGVKTKPTDLCQLIKSIDVQSFMVEGRNITVNIHAIPQCIVEANELLRDAIINLVSNAVKHSEEEKPLTIDVKIEPVKENGQLFYRCIVEDNGPGIPDELKTKLFQRFQRGTTKAYGKGLGLYLARTLVEGYHGRVWVEDRVPGDHKMGSRFVVELPAA